MLKNKDAAKGKRGKGFGGVVNARWPTLSASSAPRVAKAPLLTANKGCAKKNKALFKFGKTSRPIQSGLAPPLDHHNNTS